MQLRKCPYTVTGEHSPNVILKDNDIKYKIRLSTDTTRQILRQIKSDADYLCSVGIMDYSLLLGVHNTEYEVYEDTLTGEMTLLRVGANLTDEIILDNAEETESAAATGSLKLDSHMIPTPLATAAVNPPLPPSSTNTVPGSSNTTTRPTLISRRASMLGRRPTFSAAPTSQSFCGTCDPIEYPDDSGYLTTPSVSVESSHMSSLNSHTIRRGDKAKLSRANAGGAAGDDEDDINLVNRLEVYRVVGPDSYYMGIIDFNQKWTIKKKVML